MSTDPKKIRIPDKRWDKWQEKLDDEPMLADNRTQAIREAMQLYLASAEAGRQARIAIKDELRRQRMELDPSLVDDRFEDLQASLDSQFRKLDELEAAIEEIHPDAPGQTSE